MTNASINQTEVQQRNISIKAVIYQAQAQGIDLNLTRKELCP